MVSNKLEACAGQFSMLLFHVGFMKAIDKRYFLTSSILRWYSNISPTVVVIVSRFSPIAASLSQAELVKVRVSISAELVSSGFRVTADRAFADYVVFARCKFDEDSPSKLRPVVVFMKENPKPYLPP